MGENVGDVVGLLVGLPDGDALGLPEGLTLGLPLGKALGAAEGANVGREKKSMRASVAFRPLRYIRTSYMAPLKWLYPLGP